MELKNEFRVDLPVDRAWAVLTDLERIAPCLPGAQLQEVEGEVYRGVVKVKVGPVQAQYKGEASFLERDDDKHVVVLRAKGRETRGHGSADATITAWLEPDGEGTAVALVADLTITGRVAQFGRGVLEDVSANLLGQFVENLETTVLGEEATEAPTAAPRTEEEAAGGVRHIDAPEATPVDLMGTAGSPVAKRLVPAVVLAIVAALVLRSLTRRRQAEG